MTRDLQLSLFLGSMAVMEGRDLEHIRARFADIYQPVMLANWKVWPAAQVSQLAYQVRGIVDRRYDSLSILGSCPCPIVFHFNKHVEYSGRCTCPSSTPRELCCHLPDNLYLLTRCTLI